MSKFYVSKTLSRNIVYWYSGKCFRNDGSNHTGVRTTRHRRTSALGVLLYSPRIFFLGDQDPDSCRDRCHAWYLMSTCVRPLGRCSRDPALYVHSLATLTTCAIELLSTRFVPRFVHSLFALEFPPSKLQRTKRAPLSKIYPGFEEKSRGIVYLKLFTIVAFKPYI